MNNYQVLQGLINRIALAIDKGMRCISCGTPNAIDPGHYYSVGAWPSLRFNLHNIHRQCRECNGVKCGNVNEYENGLIGRYGKDYLDNLESLRVKYKTLKLTKYECEEAIEVAKDLLYMYEKDMDIKHHAYSGDYANLKLGIYK
jgi:hypothetical protein